MRQHTTSCHFPEGCTCGATAWNELEQQLEEARASANSAWENRNHFCKEINIIGKNIIGPRIGSFQGDCCAPEAVTRETRLLIESLEKQLCAAWNLAECCLEVLGNDTGERALRLAGLLKGLKILATPKTPVEHRRESDEAMFGRAEPTAVITDARPLASPRMNAQEARKTAERLVLAETTEPPTPLLDYVMGRIREQVADRCFELTRPLSGYEGEEYTTAEREALWECLRAQGYKVMLRDYPFSGAEYALITW